MIVALSCNTENDERTFQHTVVSPGLALGGSSLQFSLITFTVEAGRQAGGWGDGRRLAVITAACATTSCTVDRMLPGNLSVAFRVFFFILVVRLYLCFSFCSNQNLSLLLVPLLVTSTQTLAVCHVCLYLALEPRPRGLGAFTFHHSISDVSSEPRHRDKVSCSSHGTVGF